MESILRQLKQRQIFKVATIYALAAWPLIQVADLAVPMLGLPDSAMALVFKIFIIGFPISLIFAWVINFTTEGMVLASSQSDTPEKSGYKSNIRAIIAVAGSLVVALAVTIGSQLLIDSPNSISQQLLGDGGSSINTPPVLSEGKKESIAILPFEVFTDDAEDEYFVDGMVEELLNLLAKIQDLQVAARTSSFSYKGVKDKTIVEIGSELGVGTILEGSIRKNDTNNRIRVTAQLIKVSTGEHLWSETYDREYRDIFQVQDDIANAVVDKMKVTLLGDGATKHEFIVGTDNVDAMVEFGKGQEELAHRTVPSLEKALQHYETAVEKDDKYARAYVGIADANILLALYGSRSITDSRDIAEQALQKALSINPQLGVAHASMGLLYNTIDNDRAESSFKRAIELNPSYAMTYMWYGSLMKERGELDKALPLFEKALELDPKSPVAAYNIAWSYYQNGDEDKAMDLFSYIIANDPYYPGAYNLVGNILSNRGHLDESIEMYKRALQVDSLNKEAIGGLLVANMDMGDFAAADRWFAFLDQHPAILSHSKTVLIKARYFAAQGKIDKSLSYLEKVEFSEDELKLNLFIKADTAFYKGEYSKVVKLFNDLRDTEKGDDGYFFHFARGQAAIHLAYAYQQLDEPKKADELIQKYEQYLQNSLSKKANRPTYYYNMALIKGLQGNDNEVFTYLQGAIDVGWVQVWFSAIEPIFEPIRDNERFAQMMGGVNARLANMRTKAQESKNYLADGK